MSKPSGRVKLRALVMVLTVGCRYALALVFLAAAITKITDLHGFADSLILHSGLPVRLALVLASVLPWLELVCASCLLLGRAVPESAAILAVLLVAFLGYSLFHLHEAACSCFLFPGPRSVQLVWWVPVRDLLLLLGSLVVGLRH